MRSQHSRSTVPSLGKKGLYLIMASDNSSILDSVTQASDCLNITFKQLNIMFSFLWLILPHCYPGLKLLFAYLCSWLGWVQGYCFRCLQFHFFLIMADLLFSLLAADLLFHPHMAPLCHVQDCRTMGNPGRGTVQYNKTRKTTLHLESWGPGGTLFCTTKGT